MNSEACMCAILCNATHVFGMGDCQTDSQTTTNMMAAVIHVHDVAKLTLNEENCVEIYFHVLICLTNMWTSFSLWNYCDGVYDGGYKIDIIVTVMYEWKNKWRDSIIK